MKELSTLERVKTLAVLFGLVLLGLFAYYGFWFTTQRSEAIRRYHREMNSLARFVEDRLKDQLGSLQSVTRVEPVTEGSSGPNVKELLAAISGSKRPPLQVSLLAVPGFSKNRWILPCDFTWRPGHEGKMLDFTLDRFFTFQKAQVEKKVNPDQSLQNPQPDDSENPKTNSLQRTALVRIEGSVDLRQDYQEIVETLPFDHLLLADNASGGIIFSWSRDHLGEPRPRALGKTEIWESTLAFEQLPAGATSGRALLSLSGPALREEEIGGVRYKLFPREIRLSPGQWFNEREVASTTKADSLDAEPWRGGVCEPKSSEVILRAVGLVKSEKLRQESLAFPLGTSYTILLLFITALATWIFLQTPRPALPWLLTCTGFLLAALAVSAVATWYRLHDTWAGREQLRALAQSLDEEVRVEVQDSTNAVASMTQRALEKCFANLHSTTKKKQGTAPWPCPIVLISEQSEMTDRFMRFFLADSNGNYRTYWTAKLDPLRVADIRDRPYFKAIMNDGEKKIFEPLISHSTGQPVTIFAKSTGALDGSFLLAAGVGMLKRLEKVPLPSSFSFAVIDLDPNDRWRVLYAGGKAMVLDERVLDIVSREDGFELQAWASPTRKPLRLLWKGRMHDVHVEKMLSRKGWALLVLRDLSDSDAALSASLSVAAGFLGWLWSAALLIGVGAYLVFSCREETSNWILCLVKFRGLSGLLLALFGLTAFISFGTFISGQSGLGQRPYSPFPLLSTLILGALILCAIVCYAFLRALADAKNNSKREHISPDPAPREHLLLAAFIVVFLFFGPALAISIWSSRAEGLIQTTLTLDSLQKDRNRLLEDEKNSRDQKDEKNGRDQIAPPDPWQLGCPGVPGGRLHSVLFKLPQPLAEWIDVFRPKFSDSLREGRKLLTDSEPRWALQHNGRWCFGKDAKSPDMVSGPSELATNKREILWLLSAGTLLSVLIIFRLTYWRLKMSEKQTNGRAARPSGSGDFQTVVIALVFTVGLILLFANESAFAALVSTCGSLALLLQHLQKLLGTKGSS